MPKNRSCGSTAKRLPSRSLSSLAYARTARRCCSRADRLLRFAARRLRMASVARPRQRPRSAHRQQACAADRPAAPCSSTPSSCHQQCSAWRAAPRSPRLPCRHQHTPGAPRTRLPVWRRGRQGYGEPGLAQMSSSPSIMAWMNSRTRSRTPPSIGSNQLSKR